MATRLRRNTKPRGTRPVTPWLMVLPAIILELIVHIIPMLVGVWMSFVGLTQFFIANWDKAPYDGISNYEKALRFNAPLGKGLLHSLEVTTVYTIVVVGLSWFFGFSAALVLNRSFRGRGLFRTLFLIPYAMPIYTGIMTWSFMFQRDNGLINHLMKNLGLGNGHTFWLVGNNAFYSMTIVAIWRTWPFAFLMLLAGMQSISDDVYEAASIDGAGFWSQVRHMTLPTLRPVNTVLILMMFLWTFNDFNTPFVLFGQQPPPSADLIALHIYDTSFINWDFGLGSSMSVILLVILAIVTSLYLTIMNKGVRRARTRVV